VDKTVLKILSQLDYPPIFFISIEQYEHLDGVSLSGDFGISSVKYPVFTIRRGLRGKVKENVIFHEVFHILFPHWKHWKVECAAEKVARGGGRGHWARKYGKTVDDVPSRARILELARRASARMKH
jgi:hypothetical protein